MIYLKWLTIKNIPVVDVTKAMQEHCSFLGMIGEGSKPSSIIGRTKALAVARPFLGRAKIILFFVYSIANPK